MSDDVEQLRSYSILCYILSGLIVLIACVPFRYLILGIQLMFIPSMRHGDMDGVVGLIFIVFAGGILGVLMSFAICSFRLGRNLGQQQRYHECRTLMFCIGLFIPLGTLLVLWIHGFLKQPSTKMLFKDENAAGSPGHSAHSKP